jgi:hypothetical protein
MICWATMTSNPVSFRRPLCRSEGPRETHGLNLQDRLGTLALPAPFRICKLLIPLSDGETDPASGHHVIAFLRCTPRLLAKPYRSDSLVKRNIAGSRFLFPQLHSACMSSSARRANLPIANGADAARIRSAARTSTTTPRPTAIRGMSRCRHAYRVDSFCRRQRQNSVSCSARTPPWV